MSTLTLGEQEGKKVKLQKEDEDEGPADNKVTLPEQVEDEGGSPTTGAQGKQLNLRQDHLQR